MLLFVCLIVGAVALDPRELEQGLQSAEGQVYCTVEPPHRCFFGLAGIVRALSEAV